jgi:hypothetical protein
MALTWLQVKLGLVISQARFLRWQRGIRTLAQFQEPQIVTRVFSRWQCGTKSFGLIFGETCIGEIKQHQNHFSFFSYTLPIVVMYAYPSIIYVLLLIFFSPIIIT